MATTSLRTQTATKWSGEEVLCINSSNRYKLRRSRGPCLITLDAPLTQFFLSLLPLDSRLGPSVTRFHSDSNSSFGFTANFHSLIFLFEHSEALARTHNA